MSSANAVLSPPETHQPDLPPSSQRPKPSKPSFLGTTFASLQVRNYRLYVLSQVLTNTCGWMQRITQDWLMLQLTGSVAMVGLTVTLQLGPMLLFGLWGGVLADRFDKHRLLMITQSMFGLSALALAILVLTGAVEPWHILASASFLGLATVVDNPARQAFVPEVAGQTHLPNAISINSTVFQMGHLVGPALAGVSIAAVGSGWSFLVNAVACTSAVGLLLAMRRNELSPSPVVVRARGQLRDGLRYVRSKPEILWTVVLVGFVGLTGTNLATVLTAYADTVFHSGSSGYGLLSSSVAAGAVMGALASTRRKSLRMRHLVITAGALGILQLIASLVGSELAYAAVLVFVGAATLLYLTGSNTLVQTSVTPTMRGRVMSLYVLVLFGAQAGSGTLIGAVAESFGAQTAMVVTGAGPLIGAVVVGIVLIRRRSRVVSAENVARGGPTHDHRSYRLVERRHRHSPAGLRRVPGATAGNRGHRHIGARRRLSPYRHRADVPQRERSRRRDRRV